MCRSAGHSRWVVSITAAMCIAVGKVSLEDWLTLTWSFGWTGVLEPISPPRISIARLAITSLAFMFDCVPEPVCQTASGKCSSSLPSITSCGGLRDRVGEFPVELAEFALDSAAAFLTTPSARTTGTGIFSVPIGKLASERPVWAPQ